ncbi:MAG: DnaJ domain-containing protein [Pseudomonadota bacterium]|nr:DnaJ domain-containing protein [Pseudomonadota bacterium]
MKGNFDGMGYYRVLEVTPNAPLSIIKQQYYNRAKYWHPDHNENPDAVEVFQKISLAYNLLKDQKKRLQYDLLSLVYEEKDFPDMEVLKIYKNQKGQEDAALRVLKQRRVYACISGYKIKETKDICNYAEAKDMVLSTSVSNWLRGWWGVKAFPENLKAIKFNLSAVGAKDEDNLKLLIHNAIAYNKADRNDMAWLYAKQAYMLVPPESRAHELLQTYIDILDFHPQKTIILPKWSASELKMRQMVLPVFAGAVAAVYAVFILGKVGFVSLPQHRNSSYYQEMVIGGVRVADDRIEARIIKIDGDKSNENYFYHLKDAGNIYYGPDSRYDVLAAGIKGQTVRVVGYTPDKNWFKIIIDNGEAGYVNKGNLEKGMGNPLPPRSRVK